MIFKVSQSKVKTWRRCHQAYQFKYVEELRRKKKSRPLQFGSMIHSALERHFNGDEFTEYFDELRRDVEAMRLFQLERDEFGNILEDCEDIMADYVEYWKYYGLRPIRRKGRGAEHEFEIELLPDVVWEGKIDFIAKTKGKLKVLGEHKTYTRKPNDDDRWRDLQSATYFRAIDILGWPTLDACLWDYIKSKPPAIPGVLKDGSISTKKIDTLPSTIDRVIASSPTSAGNTKPENLRALRSMAEKSRNEYFHRVITPVNSNVVDKVFEDFVSTVVDLVENHGKKQDMNIDKHCSWCDYESICRARLQGMDVDYVKQREYTHGNSKPNKEASKTHRASVDKPTDKKSR